MENSKTVKIESKIRSFSVKERNSSDTSSYEDLLEKVKVLSKEVERLSENKLITKPKNAHLSGTTYKVESSPVSEDAYYVTISDIIVDGKKRPYQIFINSKSPQHYQWITALTRVISSVFRRDRNLGFLARDLKEIFGADNGYYRPGGQYYNSIVAEIGSFIEAHLKSIRDYNDLIEEDPSYSEEEIERIMEKRGEDRVDDSGLYKSATVCPSCKERKYVNTGGCSSCLSCGHSTCG